MSVASEIASIRRDFARIEALWAPTGEPPEWATDPATAEEAPTQEAQLEEIAARVKALADRLKPPPI